MEELNINWDTNYRQKMFKKKTERITGEALKKSVEKAWEDRGLDV